MRPVKRRQCLVCVVWLPSYGGSAVAFKLQGKEYVRTPRRFCVPCGVKYNFVIPTAGQVAGDA